MKRTLLLMTAAISGMLAYAQKYDRDNLEFNNTHLPSKLIYDQIKTYGYSYAMNSGAQLSESELSGFCYQFHSFDRADYNSADMKITYSVGPFSFVEEKTVSRTEVQEVNKQKVNVTKFKRVYSYRYPIRMDVINRKNNVPLYAAEHPNDQALSFETSEFNSESEAINYFNKTKAEALHNHIVQHIKDFTGRVNSALADQYDFYPHTSYLNVFQFKKWSQDEEYNKHVDHVKQVLKTMTAGESPAASREKLKDDVAYFQQFEGVFKPGDKKEDILYFGNYMNLATIFFCLDDMDNAGFYIQKLDSSDKKENMSKGLTNYINSAKTRMAKHFVTTTHLDYNPVKDYRLADKKFASDALSAAQNMVQGLGAEGIAKATDVAQLTNGTSLKGKIIYYAEINALKILPASNPDAAVTLNAENTISFTIDSIQYKSCKHRYGGPVVKQFFKVVYESPKIALLSAVNANLAESGTYAAIRPNEEVAYIWAGMGMKKNLGKYFEDCETVSKKAKDGEYGGTMNADIKKYVKMCEDYTNECGLKSTASN